MKSLVIFMTVMWTMILVLAAFLVLFVAPLERFVGNGFDRLSISAIQAILAIGLVIVLILCLRKVKGMYVERTLKPR